MDQSQNKQVEGAAVLKNYNAPKFEVYGRLVDLTATNANPNNIDNISGAGRLPGTNV